MHLPVPLMPDNKLVRGSSSSSSSSHKLTVSSDSPSLSSIGRKFNYDMSAVMGLPPPRPAPPPSLYLDSEQKDRRMRLRKATAVENSYQASTPEKFQGNESVDDSQENASLLSELPELELFDVSPFSTR